MTEQPKRGRGRPRIHDVSREHASSIAELLEAQVAGKPLPTSVRLQLTFRPEVVLELLRHAEQHNIETCAEAIRGMIRRQKQIDRLTEQGGRLVVEMPDGSKYHLLAD